MIASPDLLNFMQGHLIDELPLQYHATDQRKRQSLLARQENPASTSRTSFNCGRNLAITAGLRFDWDGGLTEKNGNLLNFDPSKYAYDPTTDTLTSNGLIIAGNNPKFGTPGCEQHDADRAPMGFCAPAWRCLEPEDVQQQICCTCRLGHVLRPRRALLLSVAGANSEHHQRRAVRDQSAAALRHDAVLPDVTFPVLSHPCYQNPFRATTACIPVGSPAGHSRPAIHSVVLPNACTLCRYSNPTASVCRTSGLYLTLRNPRLSIWAPTRGTTSSHTR